MSRMLQQAKNILEASGSFVVPELDLLFYSNKSPILIAPPKRIPLQSVLVLDDVLALESGGKQLMVAINPGESTEERLIGGNDSSLAVYIDVQKENFASELVHGVHCKTWLYNAYAHRVYKRFLEVADSLSVTYEGERGRVADCPRQVRVYRGKPYAIRELDCMDCEYCIDLQEENVVLCTARNRIAVPEDFGKPYTERSLPHEEMAVLSKTDMVQNLHCPKCGAGLVERQGTNGMFLACSAYPFCHFTAEWKEDSVPSFSWYGAE
ncbi:MAG: hypothetical protein E7418_02665 [Ruminococcaceae bacterium]|nr:hypothetical protein [Oscillospiraceae bacterium]